MSNSKAKNKHEQTIRPIDKTRAIHGKIEEQLNECRDLDLNRYDDVYKAVTENHIVVALSYIRKKKLDEFNLAKIFALLALQVEKNQLNVATLENKIRLIEAYFEEQKGIANSTNKGGNTLNNFMFDISKQKADEYMFRVGKFPSGGWLSKTVSTEVEIYGSKYEEKKSRGEKLTVYEEAYLAEYLKRKSKVIDGGVFLPVTTASNYLRTIRNN